MDIYWFSDPQLKTGVRSSLPLVAKDIVRFKPEIIICGGDLYDMPSLSAFDLGKNSFHERRYLEDIEVGDRAQDEFFEIIKRGKRNNRKWKPEFIFLWGNHEFRILRAKEEIPSNFQGLIDNHMPDLSRWDKVYPFLEIMQLSGVCFSHYISQEFSNRPITTAKAILTKKHCSFVCGHKQAFEQDRQIKLDGSTIMGVIMGACYFHNEIYKAQNNHHFRGAMLMKDVKNGVWTTIARPLATLDREYK